jgi:hypothetical protein
MNKKYKKEVTSRMGGKYHINLGDLVNRDFASEKKI